MDPDHLGIEALGQKGHWGWVGVGGVSSASNGIKGAEPDQRLSFNRGGEGVGMGWASQTK